MGAVMNFSRTPTCARQAAMSTSFAGVRLPQHAASVLRSPGKPLDRGTRQFMEHRFDRPLGDIRLHTDGAAAQSARSLSARAYTVGRHIVFGPEGYSLGCTTRRERLAHELTHAIQQRDPGGAALSTAQREGEARHAARSISGGGPLPEINAATPALSRDPEPGTEGDNDFEATTAEATCDIGSLCRLSLRAPEVVSRARLLRVYRACHPGVPLTRLIAGNPCLTPNFGLPPWPGAVGPRRAPAAGAAPAPAGAGGLSLPSTTIAFNLGAAAVTIDLPASLAVRLPVPFRGAERVVFSLNAGTSEFSFKVTINAVPHVQIIASASVTTEGRGAAGLTVQTTRTSCQAVNAAAARTALQSAGTRLRDAIRAVHSPPAPDPEASELSRTFAPHARYAEVIGAVAHLKSEIDRVEAPCREVPVASFNFGVQGQLTTPDEPPAPGGTSPGTFVGGSLSLHF